MNNHQIDEDLLSEEFSGYMKLKNPLDINDLKSEKGAILEIDSDIENGEEEYKPASFFRSAHLDDEVFDNNNLKICSGLLYEGKQNDSLSESEDEMEPFEMLARKMEDISPNQDGGVLKMEIEPGIGEVIAEGSRVCYHYSAYLEYSDEPFDSSILRNKPQKSHLDCNDTITGLKTALLSMRVKEKSRFLISPQYAFGAFGCSPRIPGGATIMYIVTLLGALDVSAAEEFENYSLGEKHLASFQEKYNAAKAHHRQANEYYREKKYAKAKSSYRKAAWILENMSLQNEEEEKKQTEMLFKMHSNLAQVCLDLKEPARACTECRLALEVPVKMEEDAKAKVYFRFGKAKLILNDFKSARKYLCRARNLRPNNSEVKEQLELLIKREESYLNREKIMCRKMISMDKQMNEDKKRSTKSEESPPINSDLLDSISECGTNVTLDEYEEKVAAADKSKAKTKLVEATSKVSSNVQSAFKRIVKNFAEDLSRNELILPPSLSSDELVFIRNLADAVSLEIKKDYTDKSMQWKLVRL